MSSLALAYRVATTFTKSGEIDEEAQRRYLQRFIDTNIEVYLALRRDVALYVPLRGSLNTFTLGAAGLVGGQLNLTPGTYRRYVNLYEGRKLNEMGKVFSDLMRTNQYVKPWDKINGRMVKMFMHVLKLPGWEGGLREPCRMPPDAELKKFADGLLRLRVPEIDEMARVAGLSVPA